LSDELLLIAPRRLVLASVDEAPLEPDQISARALVSGISAGTELALYRGVSPFAEKRFDLDLRLFVEDAVGDGYPLRLGYEWVGVVVEVGAEVRVLAAGDRIHVPLSHRRTHAVTVADPPPWLLLPAGLDEEQASLLQSITIALQAVRDARIRAADRVAVFGLGVLGLLALQLARLDGASWIVAIDPVETRRRVAAAYGADLVLDPAACDVGCEIKTASAHRGVDVAIEFSGRYAALHEAMRSVRIAGTVVAAGFYVGGAGDDLRLGEEWLHNRLTMVASMQGWGTPPRDPAWSRQRLREAALDLLASGRLRTDELITQRIPFEDAAQAYALIDERPEETLRVLLTYD
jgi:2-desacetyl-2-hydroxyethyl bacteriochlorophyllide A dehydrogenase